MRKYFYYNDGKTYVIKGYLDCFNRVKLKIYERKFYNVTFPVIFPTFRDKKIGERIISYIDDFEPIEKQINREVIDFIMKYRKKQKIINFFYER